MDNPALRAPHSALPPRQKGVTLIELLAVISIIAFLAGALVVASQRFRYQAQVHGTTSLIEKICNANEQFYNDWRFYAPDSECEAGGRRWRYNPSPSFPSGDVETREVDPAAPGMPGNRMPTTGNEYMMINLALDRSYLFLGQEQLGGPRRAITLDNNRTIESRCIIVDSWGHPIFYDCHKPEAKRYAGGGIMHNMNAFDVFSLGPDGRTSSSTNKIDDDGDGAIDNVAENDPSQLGQSADDINNWRGTERD